MRGEGGGEKKEKTREEGEGEEGLRGWQQSNDDDDDDMWKRCVITNYTLNRFYLREEKEEKCAVLNSRN